MAVRDLANVLTFVVCLSLVVADYQLIVLHTNDLSSRIEEANKYGGRCLEGDECYGGVARRATKVKEARDSYTNVVLVDSGDAVQGTSWFTFYGGYETSHFMSVLGYDAMSLANHEFDEGVDGAVRFISNATFPVVNVNIDASKEPILQDLLKISTVKILSGQKVAILGYSRQAIEFLVDPKGIKKLKFLDPVEPLTQEIDRLKAEGINKFIVLGNENMVENQKLASAVSDIDVIVGGHSGGFLYTGDPPSNEKPVAEYPKVISHADGRKTLIVQAHAHGKYLGFLDVTFDDGGEIVQYGGNPILLDDDISADPDVESQVAAWAGPLEEYINRVIGHSYVLLEGGNVCRARECNLGNLIADAIVVENLIRPADKGWTNTSIAMWNSGGIRKSIRPGDLSLSNFMETMPYRNAVEELKLKGSDLLKVLEHSVSDLPTSGRFLQYSGLRVVYNIDKPIGQRVVSVEVRCNTCETPSYSALNVSEVYSVLTNDFLVNGGDQYTTLAEDAISRDYIGKLVFDEVGNFFEKHSPLISEIEGRIKFVKDPPPTPEPKAPTCLANQPHAFCALIVCLLFLARQLKA